MDISVVWAGEEAYVKPGCGKRPRVCTERIFQDTADSAQSVRLRTYCSPQSHQSLYHLHTQKDKLSTLLLTLTSDLLP